MPQSLANILVHAVWSTKDRRPLVSDKLRAGLHGYLAGILKKLESPAIIINSVADHVRVFCMLSKNLAACRLVEEVKKSSTKWMKSNGEVGFAWQNGYGIFSVSQSNAIVVKKYITGQAEHHIKRDFMTEFREFCLRHNVAIDERYVWD